MRMKNEEAKKYYHRIKDKRKTSKRNNLIQLRFLSLRYYIDTYRRPSSELRSLNIIRKVINVDEHKILYKETDLERKMIYFFFHTLFGLTVRTREYEGVQKKE